MKKLITCFALASLLALGGSAFADFGTVDDVPAATLLLPYFEVDLDDPTGVTTLFSINNASAAPAIAHVVVWTDLSIHVLDFNVYLTGYDVWTQNLRDLFIDGFSPRTESISDGDAISPVGDLSVLTNPITGVGPGTCAAELPYSDPILNQTYLDHIQAALTGQGSTFFGGACSGYDYGDSIMRGYITIDHVNSCDLGFPQDPAYFDAVNNGLPPHRFANNVNQLWGDYFYVYDGENFAQGETMVHIEADSTADPLGSLLYTFYNRYTADEASQDDREGLTSTFAVRFLNGGAFSGGTDLLVWRDSKSNVIPFSCALPFPTATYPLGQNEIVIFDEDENPVVPEGCEISPCPTTEGLVPFPFEAQRTQVGGADFPVPYSFGWLYLNLNSLVLTDVTRPDLIGVMQNWVTPVMDANGRFSVGFDALQLDNVTFPADRSNVLIAP